MLEEYKNLIKQYHRALLRRDIAELRRLVADSVEIDLDSADDQLDQMNLPLTGDLEITAISVEGNGKIVTIHYLSRFKDREYPMVAYVRRGRETIKLNHALPQLD